MALQELANMMLPSLMEDIDTKKAVSSMPKEIKKKIEDDYEDDDEEDEKKKPKVASLSLTRLVSMPGRHMDIDKKPAKATRKKR